MSKETCPFGWFGIKCWGIKFPNLPPSNYSYLVAILSAKELNSLWGSSTVSRVTGIDMIDLNVICNVWGVKRMPKHICTQWNLSANCPWTRKSRLQRGLLCHPGHKLAKIKGITRSDRPIYIRALGYFVGQWLEILRNFSYQKLICRKSSFLQDPGYVKGVEGLCCIFYATL